MIRHGWNQRNKGTWHVTDTLSYNAINSTKCIVIVSRKHAMAIRFSNDIYTGGDRKERKVNNNWML